MNDVMTYLCVLIWYRAVTDTNHNYTIDDVPEIFREKVIERLAKDNEGA